MLKYCNEIAVDAEIFMLKKFFDQDQTPFKVNLGVNGFTTELGKMWSLKVVRTAEKNILEDEKLDFRYLPPIGLPSFRKLTIELILGEDNPAVVEERALGVQCLGRLGGLRIAAEFLCKSLGYDTLYVAVQSESIIKKMFERSGFKTIKHYKYWNYQTKSLDFEALILVLLHAPENAVVVFSCCGHYPTGCDPTREQWEQIANVMEDRNLFPIFECSFAGICSGNVDDDAWPVRYFISRDFELICTHSFSYSFCMHNNCTESLTIVARFKDDIPKIQTHIMYIITTIYRCPPCHGARIVEKILGNPKMRQEWNESLEFMANRLKIARGNLRQAIEILDTPGDWSHLTEQIGMFSYSGLNERQVQHMIQKHHIYMMTTGRMNICGITPRNVKYVALAIKDTVTKIR